MSDGATEAMLERRLNDTTPAEWDALRIKPSVAAAINRSEVIDDDSMPEYHSDRINVLPARETQVGGNYYKKLKIQPMEYSMANDLDACQHTIIKYVTRFRDKNGIEDLEKAKHTIDMLIEFEREKGCEDE